MISTARSALASAYRLRMACINSYMYPCCCYFDVLGFARNCEKGAATSLNAAVNPELNKEEFVYYSDCKPARTSAAAMWEWVAHIELYLCSTVRMWDMSTDCLHNTLSPEGVKFLCCHGHSSKSCDVRVIWEALAKEIIVFRTKRHTRRCLQPNLSVRIQKRSNWSQRIVKIIHPKSEEADIFVRCHATTTCFLSFG